MSPFVMTLRRILIRVWSVNWHLLKGYVTYRLGRLTKARRHFRRVLDLNPDHYRARVALGHIYFQFLEVREGLVQFSHARKLDPVRFERSGLQKYVQNYEVDAPFLSEKNKTPLFALRGDLEIESNTVGSTESWELESLFAGIDEEPDRPVGDFSSLQEYGRFKDLPPITRDEIREIDWSAVNSDLFD